MLPSVVLTFLSFIAFFMDPDTGERLGSGSPDRPLPAAPSQCAALLRGAEGRRR